MYSILEFKLFGGMDFRDVMFLYNVHGINSTPIKFLSAHNALAVKKCCGNKVYEKLFKIHENFNFHCEIFPQDS